MSLRTSIREYLLMDDAIRDAEIVDDETRGRANDAFQLAIQKRRAAEALDAAGAFAEAIRVIKESDAAIDDAWTTLEKRGRARATERLDSHSRDAAVSAIEQAELKRAMRSLDASCSDLFLATRDAAHLRRLRVRRWLECAALLVGMVFMVRLAYEVRYGVHIRASTELSPAWSADRAIDGDKETDWVAGDSSAWIELQFHAPRDFHHVWIRNGEFFPDRGAKDVKIELYDEDAVRWTTIKTFAHAPSEYLQFEPNGVRASRVRITPVSFYGASAAIAEITWD